MSAEARSLFGSYARDASNPRDWAASFVASSAIYVGLAIAAVVLGSAAKKAVRQAAVEVKFGILLPDIIEEPRNQLDAVVIFPVKLFDLPLTAKLSAQNLLDSKYLFTQAGNVYYRYNRGTTVSVGLSYTY